jgi:hypothetical protein
MTAGVGGEKELCLLTWTSVEREDRGCRGDGKNVDVMNQRYREREDGGERMSGGTGGGALKIGSIKGAATDGNRRRQSFCPISDLIRVGRGVRFFSNSGDGQQTRLSNVAYIKHGTIYPSS